MEEATYIRLGLGSRAAPLWGDPLVLKLYEKRNVRIHSTVACKIGFALFAKKKSEHGPPHPFLALVGAAP